MIIPYCISLVHNSNITMTRVYTFVKFEDRIDFILASLHFTYRKVFEFKALDVYT